MELGGQSAVSTFMDFTPGFIKSSPSGSRRPQRLDRGSSSIKKGAESSAAGAGGARHKVIQVTLGQDVKLHTAENAWKPALTKKELTDENVDDDAATEVCNWARVSVCLYMSIYLTVPISVNDRKVTY